VAKASVNVGVGVQKSFALTISDDVGAAVGVCTANSTKDLLVPATFSGVGVNTTTDLKVAVTPERAVCTLKGVASGVATFNCTNVGVGKTDLLFTLADAENRECAVDSVAW